MARQKQAAPAQRADSSETMQSLRDIPEKHQNGHTVPSTTLPQPQQPQAGLLQLVFCVGGIYASFLSWAWLQERITTTAYTPGPKDSLLSPGITTEYFRYPIFINLIQAFFAFTSGSLYILFTTGAYSLPSRAAIPPLALISLTQTLASPFGYLSLVHVDYLTYTLAKSCKLLPVMALHITLFRKRYPLSKYIIVLAVTLGVATFSLYNPPKSNSNKPSKSNSTSQQSSTYGLSLLAINLLFDGLTNSIQDHIFASPTRYGKLSGPQMMTTTNAFSTLYMTLYLFLTPLIPHSLLPSITHGSTSELTSATAFLSRHPDVLNDILAFAACGAIGQLFIFETLQRFSSLLLVTVTVTRKMLTMLLSVVLYGKQLTLPQWGGVGLVFGGIGSEAFLASVEKRRKLKMKTR